MNKQQKKIVIIIVSSLAVLITLVLINDITKTIASFLTIAYLLVIIFVFGISNFRRGQIDKKITEYDITSKVDIHKIINRYIKFSILTNDKEYGNFLNFLAYIRDDKLNEAKDFSKYLGPKYQFLKYYYLYVIAYSEKDVMMISEYSKKINETILALSKSLKQSYENSIKTIEILEKGTLKKNPVYLRQFKDSKSRVFKRIAKLN